MPAAGPPIVATLSSVRVAVEANRAVAEERLEAAQAKHEEAVMHGWDGVAFTVGSALLSLESAVEELLRAEASCIAAEVQLASLYDRPSLQDVMADLSASHGEVLNADDPLAATLEWLESGAEQCEAAGASSLGQSLLALRGKVEETARALTLCQEGIQTERTRAEVMAGGSRSGETPDKTVQSVDGSPAVSPKSQGAAVDVTGRMFELRREGHGPQRHGPDVTGQQLADRVILGRDPMTGTTVDGDHGGVHLCGAHATKVRSSEAYVQADRHLRASADYASKRALVEASGDIHRKIVVERPLIEVFGPDYARHVEGVQRNGSKKHPIGDPPGSLPATPVDFTGGSIKAVYVRRHDGTYGTKTLYPDPAKKK